MRKLASAAVGEGDFIPARAALEKGPIVAIIGRTGLGEDPRLAEAVAVFTRDLPDATILPVARRANIFGALDMGLGPDLLPGRVSAGSSSGARRDRAGLGPAA